MGIPAIQPAGVGCPAIAEDLQPSSTVAVSGFSGSPHSLTDEPGNDGESAVANSIAATVCPTHGEAATYEVHMTNPTGTPGESDCQQLTVTYRVRRTGGDPGEINFSITLLEGGTTIAGPDTANDVSTGFANHSFLLTDTEYDNITDHDNLRIFVLATACGDSAPDFDVDARITSTQLKYAPK